MRLQTLPEAVAWARGNWVLPEPPLRIHQHAVEPDSALGSPLMSPAFIAYLTSSRFATTWVRQDEPCYHSASGAIACCGGAGYVARDRERFRYPMAAALVLLSRVQSRGVTPSPYRLVVLLALSGWDVQRAARLAGLVAVSYDHAKTVDALFLMALRNLHSRFSSGPLARPKWTEMSESQQRAVDSCAVSV